MFLLDKQTGLSSNAALQHVKRLLAVKKAGHTGSLDPLASGLLPVCIGRATRLSSFLLNHDKRYLVSIRLGITTTTGDSEGQSVQHRPVPELNPQILHDTLTRFTGEIKQIPPMYSALKHKGKRLYELARQGIEIERQARPVTIHEINLHGWSESQLELEVWCSKGTYIRTLAEDIGELLECGGHVISLRRTEVAALNIQQAWTIDQLEAMEDFQTRRQCVLGADQMLSDWTDIHLPVEHQRYFRQGQAVWLPRLPSKGWLRVYDHNRAFIGIAEINSEGRLAPRRLMVDPVT
ncbi:MAG: tRNA pseudouridine(55) synthase TruB [Gammaproteobacteria bacterium]|nr:tRNA pseudouridine(55) synthase TruB [Gammaproteobacteria bacterium]